MKYTLTRRRGYLVALCGCIGVLAGAFYLQVAQGLLPCSLCILQRAAFVGIAIVLTVAMVHNPKCVGAAIYTGLLLLLCSLGALVAGRHIWLQSLPAHKALQCSPGLAYVLQTLPFHEALGVVWSSSGECADQTWRFIGLTLPMWTLTALVLLMGWLAWVTIWVSRRKTTGACQ